MLILLVKSKYFIYIKVNKHLLINIKGLIMGNKIVSSQQKLISFLDNEEEMQKIAKEMQEGWHIVNLMKNGNYYAGIMEKRAREEGTVFIPPRKQFKII